MKNPYCENNCSHLVPVYLDPEKKQVKKYLCTMFVSYFDRPYGGKIRRVKRYPELEFEDGLILKCPQCMRAEDRLNKGAKR